MDYFERERELNFYADKYSSQNEEVEGEDGMETQHFQAS